MRSACGVVHFLCALLLVWVPPIVFGYPHSGDDTEIVLVEEIIQYANAADSNCSSSSSSVAALITLIDNEEEDMHAALPAAASSAAAVTHTDRADNESVMDTDAAADDLIFLAQKPQQQRPQPWEEAYHQIDLLTSDEEDSLTSGSASAENNDGVPREIELRTDDDDDDNDDDAEGEEATNGRHRSASSNIQQRSRSTPAIDMSDFVALIPAAEVKSIAANYYRNDPEVQRAYAFLSSRDFAALQQHIIAVPEMSAFLRYLNNSGLDVVGFVRTLTNLTSKPAATAEKSTKLNTSVEGGDGGNNIGKTQHATTARETTPSTTIALLETTTKEQLNGLHGLVDSILDILPQDQILSTFFDKLESNEQFSKLVDNIGSPVFAKILSNIENSVPLRNLIFTLHNNGIYITRIVDSLKAYFFLGAF